MVMCLRKLAVCLLAVSVIFLSLLVSTSSLAQVEELKILDPTEALNALTFPGGYLDVSVYDPNGLLNSGDVRAFLECPAQNYVARYRIELLSRWRDGGRSILRFRVVEDVTVDGKVVVCGLQIETAQGVLSRDRSVSVFRNVPDALTLMHISDVHLVTPLTPLGTSYHHLLSAIFLANSLDVDLVLNTGDTADHPGSVEELMYYVRALKYLVKPVLTVPGNHDGAGIPPDLYQRVYGSIVGSPYWYRRFGPYLIVGIDTVLGYADLSQLNFIEKVLKANLDAEVKVIALHYPIFRGGYRGTISPQEVANHFYSSWANVPDHARKFLELVDSYNVTLVLAGHIHSDGYAVYNGKTVFLTTLTLGGSRSYYNGYRLVRIYRNGSISVYLPTDKSLRDVVNSFNIELIHYRQVEFESGSAAFIKIVGDGFSQLPERPSVYLTSSKCVKPTVYLVRPLVGIRERVENYTAYYTRWGSSEIVIVEVRLGLEEVAPGVSVVLSCMEDEDLEPPVITRLRMFPVKPRPGVDQVLVEVSASDRTAIMGGSAKVVWYDADRNPISHTELELVPADPEHTKLSVSIPPAKASYASLTLQLFDAFGNTASETISIEYLSPTPTPSSPVPSPTPTTPTLTTPTPTPTTPTATPTPQTTPQVTTPTLTPTPTSSVSTTPETSYTVPSPTTALASEVGFSLSMLTAIATLIVALAIATILLYRKTRR
ncbi:MAG: metallophosphoesterase [Sulfolobales archaeon]